MSIAIIFDLEWNSWKGNYKLNNHLLEIRKKWQSRDIIQIGALKFNYRNYVIIEEFKIFVKPKNIFLHNYIINLTKTKTSILKKKGYFFFSANNLFRKFISNSNLLICNGNDYLIYNENIKINFLNNFFFKNKKVVNIRNFLKKKFKLNEIKVSSTNLYIDDNMPIHDSLNDAKRIYNFLKMNNVSVSDFLNFKI